MPDQNELTVKTLKEKGKKNTFVYFWLITATLLLQTIICLLSISEIVADTTSLVSCLSLPDHSALAILLITAKISFDLATSWVLTFTPCETVHSLSLFGGAVSAIQGLNLKAAMLSPSGSPLVSVGQPVNMSFALWLHSLPETFLLACTYVMSRSPSALLIIAAYFLIIF